MGEWSGGGDWVSPSIAGVLKGVVFEVRQGYKSKDGKRQNADMVNAAMACTQEYLPCIVALSNQIDSDILRRYREKWVVMTGAVTCVSHTSTYEFMRDVIGYDLAGFFERNSKELQSLIANVVTALLNQGGPE